MKDSDKGWLLVIVMLVLLIALAILVFGTNLLTPDRFPQ